MDLLQNRINSVLPTLNEYQRRQYLAAEAKALGYGGMGIICRLAGVSYEVLARGIKELDDPNASPMPIGRSRVSGGGRKPIWESQPGILEMLKELVEPHTKGDPINMLLWTNLSLRTLSAELAFHGFSASKNAVGTMLKKLGYSLQTNKKTLSKNPSHPNRSEQFLLNVCSLHVQRPIELK